MGASRAEVAGRERVREIRRLIARMTNVSKHSIHDRIAACCVIHPHAQRR